MANRSILTPVLALYWAAFWLLNGLDKFLNGRDILFLTWTGRDRTAQFEGYFANIGIDNAPVTAVLVLLGLVELAAAVPFIGCLALVASDSEKQFTAGLKVLEIGLAVSLGLLIGFSVLDVVVGDRAELLEHGTYLIAIGVTFAIGQLHSITLDRRIEAAGPGSLPDWALPPAAEEWEPPPFEEEEDELQVIDELEQSH